MAGWWPMLLFLGILCGSMMFILVAGYVRIEAERAEAARAEANSATKPEAMPQFLLLPRPEPEVAAESDGDALVQRLRRHLIREQHEAAEFVARPSVRLLYRHSRRQVGRAAVVRHLAKEQAAVAAFVSDPSVEALYRDTNGSGRLSPGPRLERRSHGTRT